MGCIGIALVGSSTLTEDWMRKKGKILGRLKARKGSVEHS